MMRNLTEPPHWLGAMQYADGVFTPSGHTAVPMISEANSPRKSKVLLVEDHPLLRERLAQLINKSADMEVCGEVDNKDEALALIRQKMPDLAILDLTLRQSSGLDLLKELEGDGLMVPVLVLSMHDEAVYAERALKAGARGYVSKSEASAEVMRAIRKVLEGEVYLNERMTSEMLQRMSGSPESRAAGISKLSDGEFKVFQLIGSGRNTREMARELGLSESTIATLRVRIKSKLGVKDVAELYHRATEWMTEQERVAGAGQ
jgi:DNA-binding NarL/FixJ family response regulator